MTDSFTLSNEAVTKLNTDSKAHSTTVRWVTTRDPKGKQGKNYCDKTDGTTGQRDMVLVRVIREHPPSAPADLAAGDREKISHMTPLVSTNLLGGTFLKTDKSIELGFFTTLNEGTEFKFALTQRTRNSLDPQRTREGPLTPQLPSHYQPLLDQLVTLSPARDASCIPLDDVAVHLSQPIRGVDNEARTTTHGTHPISRHCTIQYWPARIIVPNQTTETSSPPDNHSSPPSSVARRQPRPLRLCMHSALSSVFSVLPRWMERQGREHASDFLELCQFQ